LAVVVIGGLGPVAAAYARDRSSEFEHWKQALQAADPRTRSDALTALRWLGQEGYPVVPHMVGAIDDPDPGVRHSAIHYLGELGPGAAAAVPRIAREFARSTEWGVPQIALVHIGAPSVPALRELATSSDGPLRWRAALTLSMIDPEGLAAAQQEMARSRDEAVREAMAAAAYVGGEKSVAALAAALRDGAPAVRTAAAASLGRITSELKWARRRTNTRAYDQAVAALTRAKNDPSGAVRAAAGHALERLERPPVPVHLH
jgi:HEAT repeat protein